MYTLKKQLVEQTHRCAAVEASVRDEMTEEMEMQMQEMEAMFQQQLADQQTLFEAKFERKMAIRDRYTNYLLIFYYYFFYLLLLFCLFLFICLDLLHV